MKLILNNAQAVLESLEDLRTAYLAACDKAILSYTVEHISQQLDAIADMTVDVADTLKQANND